MNKKLTNFGFTLIELLVVMSIIGILASLSFFALRGAREAARDARRKADLEAVRSALELYRADCNEYPASIPFGTGNLVGSCNGTTYMEDVPQDTMTGRNYSYVTSGPPYLNYVLCTALETEQAADTDCTGSCGGAVNCSYSVKNP